MAESWNMHARFPGCIEESRAVIHLDWSSIDSNLDHLMPLLNMLDDAIDENSVLE
jgi:hypothetical protein